MSWLGVARLHFGRGVTSGAGRLPHAPRAWCAVLNYSMALFFVDFTVDP